MFSDDLKKVGAMPYKTLFAVAAGLIFICQIVAMVLVVDRQVERSSVRTAQRSTEQMAIADCSEKYPGAAARDQCIAQVNAALHTTTIFIPERETLAISGVQEATGASVSAGSSPGLMQASLASH
ncbi:MAG: hypothetical protein ABIQ90_06920 [Polaromonas sp.]